MQLANIFNVRLLVFVINVATFSFAHYEIAECKDRAMKTRKDDTC